MVHGWTSSRREPMSNAGYLLDAGYNVLVFDLRGHGQSAGPIAMLGYSMGGALAIETGARGRSRLRGDRGQRLWQPGRRLPGGVPACDGPAGGALRAPPGRDWVGRPGHTLGAVRPVVDASRLHKPLLAIVGTADKVVPPSEGFDLFRAAPGPKQLLVVPGAGHVDGYRVDKALYEQTVLSFLARTIG